LEETRRLRIIMTVGLPGSGKTTWAMEYIKQNPNAVRVNKDTIRSMLYGDREWLREMEDFVCSIRDYAIVNALLKGHEIIVDDTNLNPQHRERIEQIVAGLGISVVVQDFTDVPLEACIERDSKREKPVGEKDIRGAHDRYLKSPVD
jgi:predicted kinase